MISSHFLLHTGNSVTMAAMVMEQTFFFSSPLEFYLPKPSCLSYSIRPHVLLCFLWLWSKILSPVAIQLCDPLHELALGDKSTSSCFNFYSYISRLYCDHVSHVFGAVVCTIIPAFFFSLCYNYCCYLCYTVCLIAC